MRSAQKHPWLCLVKYCKRQAQQVRQHRLGTKSINLIFPWLTDLREQADVFDVNQWKSQLEGAIGVVSCLGGFGSNDFMYKVCLIFRFVQSAKKDEPSLTFLVVVNMDTYFCCDLSDLWGVQCSSLPGGSSCRSG